MPEQEVSTDRIGKVMRDERGRFTNVKKEMLPRPIAVVPNYPQTERRGW